MSFKRTLYEEIINKLLDDSTDEGRVFKTILYPMVMTGTVFMAVRDNTLDFYVGGNVLLSYRGSSFKYNPKIFGASRESKMICPDASFMKRLENDFQSVWSECYNYCSDGKEQAERKVMQAYVPVFDRKDPVIVLDREIRLNEDGDKSKCDWLLYNTQTRKLKFVEVKLSYNSCLNMHRDGTFDVMKQLDGYSAQYQKYHDNIISQYRNHVKILNRLLGTSLPEPEDMLDTKAGLAVFETERKYAHSDQLSKKVSLFVGTSDTPIKDIWHIFES
ncbi:MAG: hypothetical protein IK093_08190 [Ruminiclostridium sp.]|nr:hypothetical protein [Ruminiclostridium sp.]